MEFFITLDRSVTDLRQLCLLHYNAAAIHDHSGIMADHFSGPKTHKAIAPQQYGGKIGRMGGGGC